MQTPSSDFILGAAAIAALIGAAARHFVPLIFKGDFWKFSKGSSDDSLSLERHEALCLPMKERLDEGDVHFKEISAEVKYIRALVVIQAPPDAIKKANEIVGIRSLNAGV